MLTPCTDGSVPVSYAWRQDFIETFLRRDAARFGISLPPEGLRRFWPMLAHLHGSASPTLAATRGLPSRGRKAGTS